MHKITPTLSTAACGARDKHRRMPSEPLISSPYQTFVGKINNKKRLSVAQSASRIESLFFVDCNKKTHTYVNSYVNFFNNLCKMHVADVLLRRICVPFVADWRYFLYCPGVTPNLFLNTMLNCARLE